MAAFQALENKLSIVRYILFCLNIVRMVVGRKSPWHKMAIYPHYHTHIPLTNCKMFSLRSAYGHFHVSTSKTFLSFETLMHVLVNG